MSSDNGHPSGLSSQAMEPEVSTLRASIPDADGWASKRLKAAYVEIESIQLGTHKFSTERGCLLSALAAIELADEYISKSQREA